MLSWDYGVGCYCVFYCCFFLCVCYQQQPFVHLDEAPYHPGLLPNHHPHPVPTQPNHVHAAVPGNHVPHPRSPPRAPRGHRGAPGRGRSRGQQRGRGRGFWNQRPLLLIPHPHSSPHNPPPPPPPSGPGPRRYLPFGMPRWRGWQRSSSSTATQPTQVLLHVLLLLRILMVVF